MMSLPLSHLQMPLAKFISQTLQKSKARYVQIFDSTKSVIDLEIGIFLFKNFLNRISNLAYLITNNLFTVCSGWFCHSRNRTPEERDDSKTSRADDRKMEDVKTQSDNQHHWRRRKLSGLKHPTEAL